MVHLYVEHVQRVCPLDYCGLALLKGLQGDSEKLLKGQPNKMKDCIGWSQTKRGIPDALRDDYPNMGSIIPVHYRFSEFVSQVLSDGINTDDFPSLQEHCKESEWFTAYLSMRKECDVKAGYEISDRELGIVIDKAHRVEANYLLAQTKNLLKDDNQLSTNRAACFEYLIRRGVVKNVIVDGSKLKPLLLQACKARAVNGTYSCEEDEVTSVFGIQNLLEMIPESYDTYKAAKAKEKKAKEKATTQDTANKEVTDIPDIVTAPSTDSADDLVVKRRQTPASQKRSAVMIDISQDDDEMEEIPCQANVSQAVARDNSVRRAFEVEHEAERIAKKQRMDNENRENLEASKKALELDRQTAQRTYDLYVQESNRKIKSLTTKQAELEATEASARSKDQKTKLRTTKGQITKIQKDLTTAKEKHDERMKLYEQDLEKINQAIDARELDRQETMMED